MKKGNFLITLLCLCTGIFSQKPKITWGDEFKLRKGSTDLEVVYADKTGAYLQEGHLAMKSYFVFGVTARESATLVKLDKNLGEQYRSDFNKELKGKEFEQFFVLAGKLYILASHYSQRDKTLELFIAEIDKSSGELTGEWQSLILFEKDEKRDVINFKISLNADSSRMILVNSVEGREKNTYQVQEFNKNMKPAGKPIIISNEFDPKTFQLEDVVYTLTNKIILVGRIYEYQEGRKKKDKFLDFVNYNIRIYDEKGKLQNEVNTGINGKWLISTRLLAGRDKDVVLAAFYSNGRRDKTIDGMLVQRIDAGNGNVISTSEKEISKALLSTAEEDDADAKEEHTDESREERKEREEYDKIKDEGEGFSRYMQFRNIFYTADQGLVILAEKYHHYYYTTTTYSPGVNGMTGSWRSRTYSVFECGDLMMCKIDGDNISWLQVLPKNQREVIMVGRNPFGTFPTYNSFFNALNMPFYAGFGAIQTPKAINIIFNDNIKNADVLRPGQKVKRVDRFSKSACFVLSVDPLTGKYTRDHFFSNADVPTAMPRLGSVIGENMYMVGKEDRVLGRTKIAVAKITVN